MSLRGIGAPALIAGLIGGLFGGLFGPPLSAAADAPAAPAAPRRVVSMNLCTDQLAMMLAAPGQLISVSDIALDPRTSAMVEEARHYPINYGQAEEIFLMKPDLVLAGTYTRRASVELLKRLGIPVITFAPASSMADVTANLHAMGEALGREAEAEVMAADFETQLAALQDELATRPSAALYYANGYSSGDHSLAGQILQAAGFDNINETSGVMPLESLVMAEPDAVIRGGAYPGHSRSEEILTHPALKAMLSERPAAPLADSDWVCGTPQVLKAVEKLRDLRDGMTP